MLLVKNIIYRTIHPIDFTEIFRVRMAVQENRLSDPGKVTEADYLDMIENRGRGWACEINGRVVGFAVIDLQANNIWALFIEPGYENQGIGTHLQLLMLEWAKSKGADYLWLSTDPGTRAEGFYQQTGWQKVGLLENGEMKFERWLNSDQAI